LDATVTGLLEGKRLLITGVVTDASIAFSVARVAQEQGAEVILTGFGRGLSLTGRIAKRLPKPAPVLELDVSNQEQLDGLEGLVREHVNGLDGVLHAVGFAPAPAMGNGVLDTGWPDVAVALQISTWSMAALAKATVPMLTPGSCILGLDFDASVAWPSYDWMGVAKAGLESLSRYLARDLGTRQIRVNLVAAGPVRTMAAKSVPGFDGLEGVWAQRAPLGWDVRSAEPVAKTCAALLSDWMPATTGEIIHVDGGVHAVGI
jgi:enoyl ACP reductase